MSGEGKRGSVCMMTENDWNRFMRFRQNVFDLIRRVDEGYHKSYEGAVDVRFSFKNIYEAHSIEDLDCVEIELHCYLLVNGRHITWGGATFSEALDKAEAWVDGWDGWRFEQERSPGTD